MGKNKKIFNLYCPKCGEFIGYCDDENHYFRNDLLDNMGKKCDCLINFIEYSDWVVERAIQFNSRYNDH